MKPLYSLRIAVVCAASFSMFSFGQSAPNFTPVTSASGPTPSKLYPIDVNNDGLTDIIQDTLQAGTTGSFFTVSINNGNGSFKTPATYKINANIQTPLTWGDFNNDGKVDVAVAIPPNQAAVYLGNGDGTFQAPVTSTLQLATGMNFVAWPQSSIVAADFDHDGNLDLVAAAYQGTDYFAGPWAVYLLRGDGQGHFINPRSIYTPTSGWLVENIVKGDFDGDDNADVAIRESMPGFCSCPYDSNIVALFGDGAANFTAEDVTAVPGQMTLGAADLNVDGATDLYGIEYGGANGPQLAVFVGHYGRQWGYRFTPIPANIPNVNPPTAFADFNGTGYFALAARTVTYPNSSNTPNTQMVYFLNPGTVSMQIVTGPSPAGLTGFQSDPVVGNFNGDTKPDMAINSSVTGNDAASTLAVGVNANTTGFYGGCSYPTSGQGIHLCNPATATTTGAVNFSASANSFGQLRKMELWLDGAKVGEEHWAWGQSSYFNLNYPSPTPGAHNATIYAVNTDNSLQRYDFRFTAN